MVKIETLPFGEVNEETVQRYKISTDEMSFTFINYGAALQSIQMPDRDGEQENVVIGFETIDDYILNPNYFGMCVGRVGGRIAEAKFELNNEVFQLEANMPPHHIHGGSNGLSYKVFETEVIENPNGQEIAVKMTASLLASEDHYPGNLKVQITHTIRADNSWTVHYFAAPDQDTIFNPTNHTYFNLNGGQNDVTDHLLTILSDERVETDKEQIPTGELIDVTGEMDYRQEKPVKIGLDDSYHLTGDPCGSRIELKHTASGRKVAIKTDAPYVIAYSAGGLDYTAQNGRHYSAGAGIALETQNIPDAVHHPELGDIRLMKTETFQSATTYYFSVE
ncbi:aldose epimerase family protein [Macrococcus carouselicus]|uniref:Aldose 1-epimerase n=1 Tax=Macrococcus carouselicus TaxID=69969 RepID=A0A9Q8FKU2_9STAP|nr:aldose epimerase family protein [Macrococcus carouselicus]TDM00809.1 galactose mutarotase [Macrococcus carouselicus]